MSFAPTRADALSRLAEFLPNAGRAYAATRNRDTGPGERSNVSTLSPAIRRRLISEQEVSEAAFRSHGLPAAEKFIQEVCWRTYWRGHLEMRPAIWRRYLADVERLESRLANDRGLAAAHAEALAANTGIDCFDFWVMELKSAGYLHNHARMCFASIWIFTLKLPWQLGAAFFYRHLLDACPAANTLSWRWVAGLQTAGKTYLASAERIRTVSGGRFEVRKPLATSAPAVAPEPPVAIVELRALPPADPGARSGLWLHTEDLSPESIVYPAAVQAIAAVDGIGGDPAGIKRRFADTALEDAIGRAWAHFDAGVDRLPEAALESALPEWAVRHRLVQLLTPYAPVGPVADRVASVRIALAAQGVSLVEIRRPWDSRAWPHAGRGFFQFKAHIADLVNPGLFG